MTVSGKVSAILAHKQATTVWSIGPNAMVIDAIQVMDEKNVAALPVMENGTLIGIVSERDYTRKSHLEGKVLQGNSRKRYNDQAAANR